MKGKALIIVSCLSIVCFYFILSTVLLSGDTTPKWGEVTHPEYVVLGKDIPISISYSKLPHLAQIFVAISFRNDAKKSEGQHNYDQLVVQISGTGRQDLLLTSYMSEHVDQIKIQVNLLKAPLNGNVSVYLLDKLDNPLVSNWIPVSSDGSPVVKAALSPLRILKKGYQTGYWKTYRGDYSLSGWIITFFYAVCCLSLIIFFLRTSFVTLLDQLFWFGIFGVIVFVSINKQLDLQMLITDVMRTALKEYQLYETRKPFQIRIISLFATLGVGTISFVMYLFRKSHKSMFVALGGIGTIFSFLVLRLISYHKIEALLVQNVGIFTVFDCFEIVGIWMVILSLIWYYKKSDFS